MAPGAAGARSVTVTVTGRPPAGARTLALDVGGSDLKALALGPGGEYLSAHLKTPTPRPATPAALIPALAGLGERARAESPFERVAVGFPGVVVRGVVHTAPNLDGDWTGVELGRALEEALGCPTRAANDADVQGFGAIEGRGTELVLTLGTGLGGALFVDGHLVPNLELGHHPWRDGRTYEELLGNAALHEVGVERWLVRIWEAIDVLDRVVNFRVLYLGGGNARLLPERLPERVARVDNVMGLIGALKLWELGAPGPS